MSFIITHPQKGVFLGSVENRFLFWSGTDLEAAGDFHCVVVPSRKYGNDLIKSWAKMDDIADQEPVVPFIPADFKMVKIDPEWRRASAAEVRALNLSFAPAVAAEPDPAPAPGMAL